jgi:membrane protein implicated in regulation of membrane protease activity
MHSDSQSSLLATAARMLWMMIGPAILFILGYMLFSDTAGWVNGIDIAFLAVLAATAGARWIEFRHGAPLTALGTTAKPADLQRHTLLVTSIGLGVWVIANVLTNVSRN